MANGNGVRSARPSIVVDGKMIASLSDGLLNMQIVENIDGLYRCELALGNWGNVGNSIGYLYFDRRQFDFATALQIKLESSTLFDGQVTGLEAHYPADSPPRICLLAEDRFQNLRMVRRTRTFEEMSDESVFKKIANEHGLTPQITLSGPTHRVLAQVNQSDLAFIRARARVLGAELWMDAKKLCAVPRSQRNGQTLTMGYKSGLREFSVLADLSQQRTGIAVNGWDVAGKTNLHYEATDSSVNAELAGDASGASILSARFGQRKEAFAHTVPLTAPETQTEAEALFRMYARRFVTGWGIAETDVRLRVGSYAELRQLGPLFSGKYYITEVKHMFDGVNGLRTEFRAERPGLGRPQQ